nr:MoxR family ATPase [Saccharopolyspora sp. ASAGF58]
MDRFAEGGYLADQRLATNVFLSTRLEKPLLLEGPAGVGKTELAKALATATGRRLLRLQCYAGQDETKALYEWDYGKQLLYNQMLRDKIGELVAGAPDLHTAVDAIGDQNSIDEVDRADEALEAVLLECLGEYQVSVPGVRQRPRVGNRDSGKKPSSPYEKPVIMCGDRTNARRKWRVFLGQRCEFSGLVIRLISRRSFRPWIRM